MESKSATVRWAPDADKEVRHYFLKRCDLCNKDWWAVAEDALCTYGSRKCDGVLWPSGYHPNLFANQYGEPYIA